MRRLNTQYQKLSAKQLLSIKEPVPLGVLTKSRVITGAEREAIEDREKMTKKKVIMVNRKSQYR